MELLDAKTYGTLCHYPVLVNFDYFIKDNPELKKECEDALAHIAKQILSLSFSRCSELNFDWNSYAMTRSGDFFSLLNFVKAKTNEALMKKGFMVWDRDAYSVSINWNRPNGVETVLTVDGEQYEKVTAPLLKKQEFDQKIPKKYPSWGKMTKQQISVEEEPIDVEEDVVQDYEQDSQVEAEIETVNYSKSKYI